MLIIIKVQQPEGLFAKEPIAPVLVVKDHRAKVPCIDVHLAFHVSHLHLFDAGSWGAGI